MPALVASIRNKVLAPNPIRRMRTGHLEMEAWHIEHLLIDARIANRARHEEICEARRVALAEGSPDVPEFREHDDYVVSKRLLDLLELRLKLCRSEVARRKLARRRRPKRR